MDQQRLHPHLRVAIGELSHIIHKIVKIPKESRSGLLIEFDRQVQQLRENLRIATTPPSTETKPGATQAIAQVARDGGQTESKIPLASLRSPRRDPVNFQGPSITPLLDNPKPRHPNQFLERNGHKAAYPTAQPLLRQNFEHTLPHQGVVAHVPGARYGLTEQKQIPSAQRMMLLSHPTPQQRFYPHHYPYGALSPPLAIPAQTTVRSYYRSRHQPAYAPWPSADHVRIVERPAEDIQIAQERYSRLFPGSVGTAFRRYTPPGSQPKRLKTAKHVCPHCHKPFDHTGNYEIHLRSHTGERPFSCAVCSRSFTSKSNMYRHEREQHSNENRRRSRSRKGENSSAAAAVGSK
mmetsp:Transcript_7034/g.13755  ORF Transcript_7034/g.13755 Transcript_7034/m.13755 type:complete len:350 (-) Transcript_7034:117-1166(-)